MSERTRAAFAVGKRVMAICHERLSLIDPDGAFGADIAPMCFAMRVVSGLPPRDREAIHAWLRCSVAKARWREAQRVSTALPGICVAVDFEITPTEVMHRV